MSAIVDLHVGMPKAGSTSIQSWLASPSTRAFLTEHDTTLCTARITEAGAVSVEPYESGAINSGHLVSVYFKARPAERRPLIDSFFARVAESAERHGRIVLSSEAFTQPLWRGDDGFLSGLANLSERVAVRLAYYVRPQHTALEAAWRQWGFRTGLGPSEYTRRRSAQMHYAETQESVAKQAPGARLIVRPFRSDLLEGGDVVSDYAGHVLGLPVPPVEPRGSIVWENRGLPLDVVNLLATLPNGVLWSNAHDNRRLDRLRDVLQAVEFPESSRVAESRQVLHAHAHRVFEAENRRLISEVGWRTDHFIPDPDPAADTGIDRLDELWAPAASEAEQAFVRTILEHLIDL